MTAAFPFAPRNRSRALHLLVALVVGVTMLLAACSSDEPASVSVVLQRVPQAQFAGFYAAADQGYYTDEGLTVNIVPGGPGVAPEVEASKSDGPEFAVSWVPKVLQARESDAGSDLVDIAQMFQRAGDPSVSWKDANITTVANFAGKKVGAWGQLATTLRWSPRPHIEGMADGVDFTRSSSPT